MVWTGTRNISWLGILTLPRTWVRVWLLLVVVVVVVVVVVGLNIFYSGIKYTEKDRCDLKCDITLSKNVDNVF